MKKVQSFGFTLEVGGEQGWVEENGEKKWKLIKPDGTYQFYLPHSCDEWSIAWGKKDEVIKEVNRFLKEAKRVLKELDAKPD